MSVVDAVEPLVNAINEFMESDFQGKATDYLHAGTRTERDEPVAKIVELANKLLGDSQHRDAVTHLTGCRIGPGEQDSFGWLTGIIYTSKGMIVFG